ncbi:hypothetical protein IAR55_006196 [Kwoniella newhampshirensis]|uniref:Myb-like domain-containing protein n=1 Tax=Kwoniella newhampshirensis TaxID=1651941 RepID=A0AAW0YU43_9TREE
MPATPKTTPNNAKRKPYGRSSASPSSSEENVIEPKVKTPKKSKLPSKNTDSPRVAKAWTNDELGQLFEHVEKAASPSRKVFEGAVEGRTPNQCYQSWINTLAPFLKKAIATKAGKSA